MTCGTRMSVKQYFHAPAAFPSSSCPGLPFLFLSSALSTPPPHPQPICSRARAPLLRTRGSGGLAVEIWRRSFGRRRGRRRRGRRPAGKMCAVTARGRSSSRGGRDTRELELCPGRGDGTDAAALWSTGSTRTAWATRRSGDRIKVEGR
jgi:hypothetical protein